MSSFELLSAPHECRPGRYPVVDAVELELMSIFPMGAECSLSWLGRTLVVCRESGDIDHPLSIYIDLSIEGNPLVLEVDQSFLAFLLSSLVGDPLSAALPFENMPSAIQLALLQTSTAPIASAFMASVGLEIRLDGIRPSEPEGRVGGRCVFQCRWDSGKGYAAITFTQGAVDLIKSSQLSIPSLRPSPQLDISNLPLAYSVEMVVNTLSCSELAEIRSRDILMFGGVSTAENEQDSTFQVVINIDGKVFFRGLLGNGQIEITHMSKDQSMEDSRDINGPQVLSQLEDLPLEVVFEIARDVTTIGQIMSLVPGSIFTLDKPLEPLHGRLMAHGQAIAEAELVQINNQFGVRIVCLCSRADPNGASEDADAT